MSQPITVPLGIVVAKERAMHSWQETSWRPIEVLLNAPEVTTWRELRREAGSVHYHAATLPLMLSKAEALAYRVNLANGVPSIYVVLRDEPQTGFRHPQVKVHMVSASPFAVREFDEPGLNTVARVPMPEPLVDVVRCFVADNGNQMRLCGTEAALLDAPRVACDDTPRYVLDVSGGLARANGA